MSEQTPGGGGSPQRPAPQAPVFQTTPNAEKYVLEADAMRRRQLRSALLHGSDRTWREHRKVWPAVAIGVVVTAVGIAGITMADALQIELGNRRAQEREQVQQQKEQEQQEREQQLQQEEAERERQQQQASPGPSVPSSAVPSVPVTPSVPVSPAPAP
ncbi:MAG: hypothetical protein Q7T56_13870 [Nocardioidaceae bacterium]|nr:hypothetical protein [Nocardioidaceae bacterium]